MTSTFNERTIMSDPTEAIRRQQLAEINAEPGSREYLEAKHGQVWNTDELQEEFQALGFMAPYVIVRRKSDGRKGSLLFQANPHHLLSLLQRPVEPFLGSLAQEHLRAGAPRYVRHDELTEPVVENCETDKWSERQSFDASEVR